MDENKKSIAKEYLSYFVPCVLMAMATQLASIVDKVFIGNFVNPLEMAAANACMPISQFVYTLSVLIGVGGAAAISVAKGRKNSADCNKIFGASIIWGLIFGAAFFLVLLAFPDFFLNFLLEDKSVQNLAKSYYLIFIFAVPLRLVSSIVQNISRADGIPRLGSVAVIVSNLCNIVFNWIFMGPLGMGVRGAAFGTLICFAVECLINLSYLLFKKRTFLLQFKGALSKTAEIFSVGLPACIGTGLITFKLVILNNLSLNLSGSSGLVAMAISISCLSLASMFSAGANNAMVPLAGKYFGTDDEKNLHLTKRISFGLLMLFTTVVVVFLEIFAGTFARFHGVSDPETLKICTESIRIYAVSLYGMSFTFYMIYFLPIIGKKSVSTAMSLCEGFIFIIPLCFLFSKLWGLNGIWLAFIATEILTAVLYFILKNLKNPFRK